MASTVFDCLLRVLAKRSEAMIATDSSTPTSTALKDRFSAVIFDMDGVIVDSELSLVDFFKQHCEENLGRTCIHIPRTVLGAVVHLIQPALMLEGIAILLCCIM